MQPLELEPIKGVKVKLVFVENEFPVDWWVTPPPKEGRDFFANLKFISKEYVKFIEGIILQHKPDFVVEEQGLRKKDEFLYDNPLIDLYTRYNLPHEMVDISENALAYITTGLDERQNLLKSIKKEIVNLLSAEEKVSSNPYMQQLVQWGEYLQQLCEEEENEIRYNIREAWMMMAILKAAQAQGKKKVTGLVICDKDHFDGFSKLSEDLGIEVEKLNIKKSVNNMDKEGSLKDLLSKSVFEIAPVKVKKAKKSETILYFFDTDDYASPFDINMAYDAGFNVVIPFSKVTAQTATKLVQDAIFSRGPKAPTTFFVGGSNVKEGEQIGKNVLKALVPPFEAPVIIDPRGSHTTASAVVAKTIAMAAEHDIESLAGKKVVVLGTGPVGRIAALLAAKLRCNTILVETWDQSSDEFVKNLAKDLTLEAGEGATEIKGEFAVTEEQKLKIVKDANVVWALAAAGIQILSKDTVQQLSPNTFLIDINAVPPLGIEGLKPKDDNKEIAPGVFGTGALALGNIKYNTESKILKEASKTKGKKIFDYNLAFELAQTILMGKRVTVSS